MSFLLAFLGFALLIILHELGHFAAAKAVGMRVERFSLFFPPLVGKVRRGETEYAIGALPLGGYVKITGMNPAEDIPPEVAHRAYFRQPVWKRIVVIAAGPAVNIVLAFVILWGVFLITGTSEPPLKVGGIEKGRPAAGVLEVGDTILRVDGRPLTGDTVNAQQQELTSRLNRTDGRRVTFRVRREGVARTLAMTPFLDRTDPKAPRWRVGFGIDGTHYEAGPGRSVGLSVSTMWDVTSKSVSAIAQIFTSAEQRKQLSGVVGSYEATRQSFEFSTSRALFVLGVISLSLGVINLFPFLPLDGGHIFWALAEKVRGRAIPFSVMERAGFVGFALVIGLFAIGLSNDLGRLFGDGFGVR
jgi:regulator of sigma E protease